jgi:hypothetical protein
MRQALRSTRGHFHGSRGSEAAATEAIAGERGFDIIQMPIDDIEPGRGWRVIEVFHSTRSRPQIVFGDPMHDPR